VVEGHCVHHTERSEVIFVWRVVAVPSHNIKWAVILLARPQGPAKLVDDDVRSVDFFKCGMGHHKMAGRGKAVGTNGPEVRQFEVAGKCLTKIT
jgi:hypothetical protein